MKLDRNITNPRRGKYALIKLRETNLSPQDKAIAVAEKLMLTVDPKAIDFGDTDDTDFFVIRLKDKYASPALLAYARAAMSDDSEYGEEIMVLSLIANRHLNKRKPD